MDSVFSSSTSEEALCYAAFTTFTHLIKAGRSGDDALTIMRVAEPFRSNWDRTVHILQAESSEGHEND